MEAEAIAPAGAGGLHIGQIGIPVGSMIGTPTSV